MENRLSRTSNGKRRRAHGAAIVFFALALLELAGCTGATKHAAENVPPEAWTPPAAQEVPAERGFSDVPESAWYAEAVRFVIENDLMDTADGSFFPGADATREIVAESLWRANGRKGCSVGADFSDVRDGDANKAAIDWAAENGVIGGMGGGVFGVGQAVTRQDFAAMLWRAAGKPSASDSVSFGDAEMIADYAKEAAAWAQENGIINGIGEDFMPRGNITRAQLATILQRYTEFRPMDKPRQ